MSLPVLLADLPRRRDIGIERDAKGFQVRWTGYEPHIDTADGDIPISRTHVGALTSASVHDSQMAIPLATLTAGRVTSLHDLMDGAPMTRPRSRPTADPSAMCRSSPSIRGPGPLSRGPGAGTAIPSFSAPHDG